MSNTKPQITATIKFRDVTIENMTIEELKALRDVLNTIVGEPPRIVEHHEHIYPRPYPAYPYGYYSPVWAVSRTTVGDNTIRLDSTAGTFAVSDNAQHYTLSCAN